MVQKILVEEAMKNTKKIMVALGLLVGASYAHGGAIISDGNVALGVNDLASLNFGSGNPDVTGISTVGLRYIDPASGDEFEATSHGCECEGWGVGILETGERGYANDAVGNAGLTLDSFNSTATSATSIVTTDNLEVTHVFELAAETDNLYRVTVSIENTGIDDIVDLVYRRTFDWDTSPTPFEELVSIGGTAAASAITGATNNGFCDSNPFSTCNELFAGGTGDFTDLGPEDHGANFDFNFGALAAGGVFSFDIFYGGAVGVSAALASLGEVGAEAFSLGRSSGDVDGDGFIDSDGSLAPTYIFGFSGVGGVALPDPTPPNDDPTGVSAPHTLGLFSLCLIALARLKRRV
jgi:type IV pilus assembly protein PilY1